MTKLVLILIAFAAVGTSTSVRPSYSSEDGQAITAAVGGGVQNPWRSPYKIV
jgi:hypothetical protein